MVKSKKARYKLAKRKGLLIVDPGGERWRKGLREKKLLSK